jgi:hypothetical protein
MEGPSGWREAHFFMFALPGANNALRGLYRDGA